MFSRGNTTGPAYGATAAQLLEFDKDGKFIREIGKNLYAWSFAHTVRVDPPDNLWAVDKGSDMIVKFNPEGRVVMVFGRKKEASDESGPVDARESAAPAVDGQFRQPTDVTWDPARQHLHQRRLHQLARRQVRQERRLGEILGREPGAKPGEFNTPHSIAADAHGNIYVADRGNRRIQVFDHDGKFLKRSPSMCLFRPSANPGLGNAPPTKLPEQHPARPGRSASRPVREPVSIARMPSPAGSTS